MSQQWHDLKFKVENLGVVHKGEFTQKSLTIFCGPNNSGKTWVMYALYFWSRMLNDPDFRCSQYHRMSHGPSVKPADFKDIMNSGLPGVFNVKETMLEGARVDLIASIKSLKALLDEKRKTRNVFLIPAERTSLHPFCHDIGNCSTISLHRMAEEIRSPGELLRNTLRSYYAQPIVDYIDWLNKIPEIMRESDKAFHRYAEILKKRLLRGAFGVDKKTGDITFKPRRSKVAGHKTREVSLHIASGTVKSLFGLWFYLEHQAKQGDLLMIEEPEINLHPANQVEMARLLARLVNAGLHLVVSTHSDYIVRELNSLIMLNQQGSSGMRKKYRYEEEEVLDPDKVGAYLFDDQVIEPIGIFTEDGIYATTFNKVISAQGKSNNDIYYTMKEIKDGY
ncbi:AAA family ATPase [Thioalkalivibrio sp. HK1]|uniref:AAA family ATPase n=1 Tax=Thioalkalivibrio sp. HK1 TaxID=1469245 RepID=UPI00047225D1|nr:ATP-binding protein [Thioalkalivibrio sp. HK1]